MSTTLDRIAALYAEQGLLYDRAGRGEWLSAAELDLFAQIRKDLAKLWPERRQELAGAKAGHLVEVVKTESTFHHAPRLPRARERAVGE